MDDLSGKISSFLDDPNNVETIKSITGLLGGSMGAGSDAEASKHDAGLGLDPEMMVKLKRIVEKTSTKNDSRVNLLLALRPYLNDKRKSSMESALKMMRLAKLASIIGEGFEL